MTAIRQLAMRVILARRPSQAVYRRYRELAEEYSEIHTFRGEKLSLPDDTKVIATLEYRPSVIFGREYLMAWVDDWQAFLRRFPANDAVMSPINIPGMPGLPALPLVVAPVRRRRSRNGSFLSVLEHEIVHANQVLAGFEIPKLAARKASDLLQDFFAYTRMEHEAHLIQLVHWPPHNLTFKAGTLSLDQWILLRAYTPALEEILRKVSLGRIHTSVAAEFLDMVPTAIPRILTKLGCQRQLAEWWRTRWMIDVFVTLEVLESQGTDLRSPLLGCIHDWLHAQALRQSKAPMRPKTSGKQLTTK